MSKQVSQGIINHTLLDRRTDYLYRISIKGLIRNENGDVLVVKETGRDWWHLPGGGMDHSENLKSAIVRELKEEVNLKGDFEYNIIAVDDPAYLKDHDFWQVRLIFKLTPTNMSFSNGEDGDEVAFMNPILFRDSNSEVERRIYNYNGLST